MILLTKNRHNQLHRINADLEPIETLLVSKELVKDPCPGIGIYRDIQPAWPRTQEKEVPVLYPCEDTTDSASILISDDENNLKYMPNKVVEELMQNLIHFINNNPNHQLIIEVKEPAKYPDPDTEIEPEIPPVSFPEEDLVNLITDQSWLTLETIGETPAPEDVFPVDHP